MSNYMGHGINANGALAMLSDGLQSQSAPKYVFVVPMASFRSWEKSGEFKLQQFMQDKQIFHPPDDSPLLRFEQYVVGIDLLPRPTPSDELKAGPPDGQVASCTSSLRFIELDEPCGAKTRRVGLGRTRKGSCVHHDQPSPQAYQQPRGARGAKEAKESSSSGVSWPSTRTTKRASVRRRRRRQTARSQQSS